MASQPATTAMSWLESVTTVIVTTSPARSDPDLDMLRAVYKSLAHAGLADARKILVCDHFNPGKAKKGGCHKGMVPQDEVDRYMERIAAFKASLAGGGEAGGEGSWARGTTVLELDHWHGFALATHAALQKTATPLVCVVQHDLAFLRRVDLVPCAELLLEAPPSGVDEECAEAGAEAGAEASAGASPGSATLGANASPPPAPAQTAPSHLLRRPPVNFICLRQNAQTYRQTMRSRCHLEVGSPVAWPRATPHDGITLTPTTTATTATPTDGDVPAVWLTRLPQFLDGVHLASTEWYKSIYGKPLLHGEPLAIGQFTEDNLGQHMLALAKARAEFVKVPRGDAWLMGGSGAGGSGGGGSSGGGSGGEAVSEASLTEDVSAGVLEMVAVHGGWLWSEMAGSGSGSGVAKSVPVIFHLDGRVFLSAAERAARGIASKDLRYAIADRAGLAVGDQGAHVGASDARAQGVAAGDGGTGEAAVGEVEAGDVAAGSSGESPAPDNDGRCA